MRIPGKEEARVGRPISMSVEAWESNVELGSDWLLNGVGTLPGTEYRGEEVGPAGPAMEALVATIAERFDGWSFV
jgi:hypothetical protein